MLHLLGKNAEFHRGFRLLLERRAALRLGMPW
jgi:hypothetical protein